MNARSETSIAAWLALLLFGVYLLTFSGRIPSYDGMSMFSVTESVVKRGELNTDQFWTTFKARDELAGDLESYAKYGFGTSLFAVPLYALALALPGVGLVQTTVLTSGIVVALTGGLLFLAARRLGYGRGVSVAVALLFGLATPAWVYARQFWSEPYSLFTLFAAWYALMRYRDKGNSRDALWAGLALGLAVAVRVTNAALVPFFAWYGFGDRWRAPQSRRGMLWFAGMLALAALAVGWYDWVRFGHPLATGYRADEGFDNPILYGLYGLLFSPGKGLCVYVPFLAALPWSMAMLASRARRELILILSVAAVYLAIFSTWYYWWDGTNWSARFLVPTLPFLTLAIAPAVELAASAFRQRARVPFAVVFGLLCVAAFGLQILGVSIPSLNYWLRMYRLPMSPVRVLFMPDLAPFVVYFDMFRPRVLDFAWVQVSNGTIVTIDWLPIMGAAAFIALCAAMLWRAVRCQGLLTADSHSFEPVLDPHLDRVVVPRGSLWDNHPWLAPTAVFVLVAVLALFSLYRYRGDYRQGGLDGYRELLGTLARESQSSDVMVLDNDLFAPFFLNENRARIRWYGLSRDPAQWDESTRTLLTRLAHSYPRVWFAYDDAAAPPDDPARDWLEQSLRVVDRRDFGDGVHLTLYATDGFE